MKHTAKYIDSGFYVVSDKAAGSLVKVLGQPLPKFGWQKFVTLEANGHKLNAWLQRTDVRSSGHKRGWVWSVFSLRKDAGEYMSPLGREFKFEAIKSTVA